MDNILNKISLENFDKNFEIPDIIYRAAFNKKYPEIYQKIKQYESFDFNVLYESFNFANLYQNTSIKLSISKKDAYKDFNLKFLGIDNDLTYSLKYKLLYIIFSSYNINYKLHLEIVVNYIFVNLLHQDNMLKILKIINSQPDLSYNINKYFDIDNIESSLSDYISINYKKEQLYYYLYKNDIITFDGNFYHSLLDFMKYNYYKLFKTLIDNEVISVNEYNLKDENIEKIEYAWINNDEFEEFYNYTKERNYERNYEEYDKLLELYGKKF